MTPLCLTRLQTITRYDINITIVVQVRIPSSRLTSNTHTLAHQKSTINTVRFPTNDNPEDNQKKKKNRECQWTFVLQTSSSSFNVFNVNNLSLPVDLSVNLNLNYETPKHRKPKNWCGKLRLGCDE
jgi:hypothetical protein